MENQEIDGITVFMKEESAKPIISEKNQHTRNS